MSHNNPPDSRAKTANDGSTPSTAENADRAKPHAKPHTAQCERIAATLNQLYSFSPIYEEFEPVNPVDLVEHILCEAEKARQNG